MTEDQFADFLADRVHRGIQTALEPIKAELRELQQLEARIMASVGRQLAESTGPASCSYDGDRSVTINGRKFSLPIPLYRGVWQSGAQYRHGDLVTHAGSMWHANADTVERPGTGSGTAWQLAVKRGAAPR